MITSALQEYPLQCLIFPVAHSLAWELQTDWNDYSTLTDAMSSRWMVSSTPTFDHKEPIETQANSGAWRIDNVSPSGSWQNALIKHTGKCSSLLFMGILKIVCYSLVQSKALPRPSLFWLHLKSRPVYLKAIYWFFRVKFKFPWFISIRFYVSFRILTRFQCSVYCKDPTIQQHSHPMLHAKLGVCVVGWADCDVLCTMLQRTPCNLC